MANDLRIRIEQFRLSRNVQADRLAVLVERETKRIGAQKKYQGRIEALRHINATADRLALDIIEDIRSER